MMPAFFVYLDRIPLTTSGKVDRKSLPAPDLSLRQVGHTYVAPHTPLEKELTSVWESVLKVKQIGVHDNFFKLGDILFLQHRCALVSETPILLMCLLKACLNTQQLKH